LSTAFFDLHVAEVLRGGLGLRIGLELGKEILDEGADVGEVVLAELGFERDSRQDWASKAA